MTPTRRTFLRFIASAAAATGLSRFAGRAGAEPVETPATDAPVPPTAIEIVCPRTTTPPDHRIYLVRSLPDPPVAAVRGMLGRTIDVRGKPCLCMSVEWDNGNSGRAKITIDPGRGGDIQYTQDLRFVERFCIYRPSGASLGCIYRPSGASLGGLVREGWKLATADEAERFMTVAA